MNTAYEETHRTLQLIVSYSSSAALSFRTRPIAIFFCRFSPDGVVAPRLGVGLEIRRSRVRLPGGTRLRNERLWFPSKCSCQSPSSMINLLPSVNACRRDEHTAYAALAVRHPAPSFTPSLIHSCLKTRVSGPHDYYVPASNVEVSNEAVIVRLSVRPSVCLMPLAHKRRVLELQWL